MSHPGDMVLLHHLSWYWTSDPLDPTTQAAPSAQVHVPFVPGRRHEAGLAVVILQDPVDFDSPVPMLVAGEGHVIWARMSSTTGMGVWAQELLEGADPL